MIKNKKYKSNIKTERTCQINMWIVKNISVPRVVKQSFIYLFFYTYDQYNRGTFEPKNRYQFHFLLPSFPDRH